MNYEGSGRSCGDWVTRSRSWSCWRGPRVTDRTTNNPSLAGLFVRLLLSGILYRQAIKGFRRDVIATWPCQRRPGIEKEALELGDILQRFRDGMLAYQVVQIGYALFAGIELQRYPIAVEIACGDDLDEGHDQTRGGSL